MRTRISSQCLKRHWRVYDGENSLKSIDAPESVPSRVSFDRFVVEPLVKEGIDEHVVRLAAQKLVGKVFGSEAKREKAEKKGGRTRTDRETPVAKSAATARDRAWQAGARLPVPACS